MARSDAIETLVQVPDEAAFAREIDVMADGAPVAGVVDALREREHLPVRVAPGLPLEGVVLTLRLRHVPARTALASIAASLGIRYRWRSRGRCAVLERAPEPRAPMAGSDLIPPELAQQFPGLLSEFGVLPDRPGDAETPVGRAAHSLDRTIDTDKWVSRLCRIYGRAALERAAVATVDLPVGDLPPADQAATYRMLCVRSQCTFLWGLEYAGRQLMGNPLLTGSAVQVELERSGWRWHVAVRPDRGVRTGFPLRVPPPPW